MKFQGFVGPSYKLDSVNVDCQRSVNLYPELIESGTGKEGQQYYLKSTPGLDKLFEIGDGPIRLIYAYSYHTMDNPTFLVISGNRLYAAEYDGGAWNTLQISNASPYNRSFGTSTSKVSAATALVTEGSDVISYTIFVDGDVSYIAKIDTADSSISDFTFGFYSDYFSPYAGPEDASQVVTIDGYYIYNKVGTNQFLVSSYSGLDADALSFASAEGDPDKIVAIIANTRDLIILNERTTEVWSNTGNADFPFERVQGGFIEKGCLAPLSAAKIDGVVLWLGRDAAGQGQVYAMQGMNPQRISTHAIEQAISSYTSPQSATGYTYQKNGHSFYVLNFAECSWCYDLSTKQWHERAYTNQGILERHRVDLISFIPDLNLHVCGDYENSSVYALDENTYTDDGDEITRMRIFPHISSGLKRIFCNSLQIDMETGVGLNATTQGHTPEGMLSFSDDGGHTWSNEKIAQLGKLGNYKRRVIFHRLGMFRDRVFKFKVTDPVSITLLSAEIDIQQGAS